MSCATSGVAASAASANATSDYNTGLALGTQAYQYGVPLLDSERVFTTGTSTARCDPATGRAAPNQFCSLRNLASASEHTAPAPNNDTLYTSAWLVNLSKEPQVIHAPAIRHRFWEFELLDPWTNNFFNITSVPSRLGPGDFGVTGGGNWALVGPRFHGRLPRGVRLVRSPDDRLWIAGRTFVRGSADLPKVHRIQNQYSITPLSKFGTPFKFRPPRQRGKSFEATIPGTNRAMTCSGSSPRWDARCSGSRLRRLIDRCSPSSSGSASARGSIRRPHILSAAMLQGLREAVRQGHIKLLVEFQKLYRRNFAKYHGYVIADLGDWGTNYKFRAVSDAIGIGGQRANIALYPVALFDETKAPLTASKRYVLHIPRNRWPIPVSAFWSLTLYDSNSFLVPNALDRYALNDLSHLHKNPDGSIDLYVQHDRPSQPAQAGNWLPAPTSGNAFRLIRASTGWARRCRECWVAAAGSHR